MANSLSSQMAALEAAHRRDQDEDSQSPENNHNKGKCEIKQESDIKTEMDDDSFNASGSGGGGGKNVNNDIASVKAEIKTEPMDVDATGPDGIKIKEEIKDEPMSPASAADAQLKRDATKAMVPVPLEPNATDKKKKCCKCRFTFHVILNTN